MNDPDRDQPVLTAGAALDKAMAAVILLHGRGASAEDILGLAGEIYDERVAYLAPQAAEHRWYPYSFLAPIAENEPALSSAINKVGAIVESIAKAGLSPEQIFLCGFSQGACLASEFIARHPARYGGLVAFTGGLIGPPDADLRHPGDLAGMPALFSSGDPDPHVPWARVQASADQFTAMGAVVQLQRYPGRPHTVLPQEIKAARDLILAPSRFLSRKFGGK
jgi:predicted esterase